MRRTSLYLFTTCFVIALVSPFAIAQHPEAETNSPTELKGVIKQLRLEIAQLRLELEDQRKELERLRQIAAAGEGEEKNEAASEELCIEIRSIRDLSDDGARQMRIAEIKREIPPVQKRHDEFQTRVANMNRENREKHNHWNLYLRRKGEAYVKPHSDQEIGRANLQRMEAATRLKRLTSELRKLEKGPTELQILVVAKATPTHNNDDANDAEYRIMFENSLAKRVQMKKPGDSVKVNGRVTDADPNYIAMEATELGDCK